MKPTDKGVIVDFINYYENCGYPIIRQSQPPANFLNICGDK